MSVYWQMSAARVASRAPPFTRSDSSPHDQRTRTSAIRSRISFGRQGCLPVRSRAEEGRRMPNRRADKSARPRSFPTSYQTVRAINYINNGTHAVPFLALNGGQHVVFRFEERFLGTSSSRGRPRSNTIVSVPVVLAAGVPPFHHSFRRREGRSQCIFSRAAKSLTHTRDSFPSTRRSRSSDDRCGPRSPTVMVDQSIMVFEGPLACIIWTLEE